MHFDFDHVCYSFKLPNSVHSGWSMGHRTGRRSRLGGIKVTRLNPLPLVPHHSGMGRQIKRRRSAIAAVATLCQTRPTKT
jgi:hypothetical protein